jgi:hypothetical protein
MRTWRILVTGWRYWPASHRSAVEEVLAAWCEEHVQPGDEVVIVQGECPYGGVDLYAKMWAYDHSTWVRNEGHAADYRNGKFLGPERNTKMVNLGADVCFAFMHPTSRGTVDCRDKARAAGIPTTTIDWSEKA